MQIEVGYFFIDAEIRKDGEAEDGETCGSTIENVDIIATKFCLTRRMVQNLGYDNQLESSDKSLKTSCRMISVYKP